MGYAVRLAGLMNLILILFRLVNINGREPYWGDLKKKKKIENKNVSLTLHSNIYCPISFKLGMVTDTVELFILITSLNGFAFCQRHSCVKK